VLEREILECAWQLIERPESWSRKALARDAAGRAVAADDPSACRWCLVGAVTRATIICDAEDSLLLSVIERLGDAAEALFQTRGLNYVNDHLGHDDIRHIFEQAIAHSMVVESTSTADCPGEVEQHRQIMVSYLTRLSALEAALENAQALITENAGLLGRMNPAAALDRLALSTSGGPQRSPH
jgi:hypothetical protein